MTGEHLSLSKIIWEEKNRTAGVNYMLEAIRRHKAGEKFNGDQPFVIYSSWTKVWEFFYVRRSYTASASKEWSEEQSGQVKRQLEDNEVANTPAKRLQGEGPVGSIEKQKGAAKAKAKASSKTSPAKLLENGGSDGKELQKQLRKEIDAGYAKCKVLKVRFDTANSLCGTMVDAVENKPEWSWAISQLPGLKVAKQKMDIITGSSEFWSLWSMTASFAVEAKKKYETTVAKQHLLGMDKIETGITDFEKTAFRVQRMHAAASVC